ncbi:MAG: division/cell wall cluster transcriptional repressor MraZ [Bdellovibrionales bacterium]|nr:division/cell wall cluster transcriptional repressor MraZ [Bdellovibrionales bacterium]
MEMLFRGRFEAKVDSKGRLLIPSAWKNSKLSTVVLTNAIYSGRPCIDVYSLQQWGLLEKRFLSKSLVKKELQNFRRFYLASGTPVEIDSNGRILVPSVLRKFAGLEGEVSLLGMGEKFEIWSEQNWSKIHQEMSLEFENTLASVVESIDED